MRSTIVRSSPGTSVESHSGYHVQLQPVEKLSGPSRGRSLSLSSRSKQRCRYALMLTVVMSSVLSAVIIVPLVNQQAPIHKKYLKNVVSVMSSLDQRRLILLAKQECFKLSRRREREMPGNRTDGQVCRVTWDDMLCWDLTTAGTMATQPCPDYVNGFNKNEFATKLCTDNGTWWINPDPEVGHEWTNFTDCVKPSIDLSLHAAHGDKLRLLYTIGYSFSLGALLVAVIIMLCCKRLHSKSNTMHINLFSAYILRAVISFLKDILFVGNVGLAKDVRTGKDGILEFVQDATHWECKLLISIFMYSVIACNMWIFVEALYLTMLVYRPLATERRGVRLYVVLGWTLSFVFIIPWVVVKALYENTFCWNFQLNPDYYWILRGSGVAVVVINFFLFLNIFRKLFLKIRHSSQLGASGKAKYRKLAKFILVLIPLFGIMYIVFYVAVPSNFEETDFNVAYLYLEMGYNSFQGFLLALLFCFLNEEVHGELKRVWRRHRSRRHELSALNKSYQYHSGQRKSQTHLTGLLLSSQCKLTPHSIRENSGPRSKDLHRLRTFSVSSEVTNDIGHHFVTPEVTHFKFPPSPPPPHNDSSVLDDEDRESASITSDTPPTTAHVAPSAHAERLDSDQSDSLLRYAMRTNAHRVLVRQSTADSISSQPLSPGLGELRIDYDEDEEYDDDVIEKETDESKTIELQDFGEKP